MCIKLGPSVLIVVLGVVGIVIAASTSIDSQEQWANHGIATILAAGIIAALAFFRHWEKFAWTPVLGMAIASAGVAIGVAPVTSIGYGLILIMSLWHGYQAEQPRPSSAVREE